MARDAKRRQKALQRKAAKRKARKKQMSRLAQRSMAPSLRHAAGWPLHEVLINEDWRDPTTLVTIIVARRSLTGHIAIGNFLVDTGCLGVKNAYGRVVNQVEYEKLLAGAREHQTLVPCDLNLAAKIIREAVAYARTLGFKPNRDHPRALQVLGEADPDACTEEIPLGGEDGKPFYFAGPYDDSARIIKRLIKAVGPDGFRFFAPLEALDEDALPAGARFVGAEEEDEEANIHSTPDATVEIDDE